jgi:hypothetical protein
MGHKPCLQELKLLNQSELVNHTETWAIQAEEHPATLESVQQIRKQLCQTQSEWSNNG